MPLLQYNVMTKFMKIHKNVEEKTFYIYAGGFRSRQYALCPAGLEQSSSGDS
jgi:hypothetical protein